MKGEFTMRIKRAAWLILLNAVMWLCVSSVGAAEGQEIKSGDPVSIDVDGTNISAYIISYDFYQDGTTYAASSNFYITSKKGLEYFQKLVSASDGGTVASEYATLFISNSTTAISFYTGNIFTNKTVHLLADIDLNNEDWTPIGYTNTAYNSGSSKTQFYGSFDGHHHTISNLKVVANTANYFKNGYGAYGLFGSIGSRAGQKFSNLTIKNVTAVSGTTATWDYVGALIGNAGSNKVYIENCHVTGNINLSASYQVGAFWGIGCVDIKNCSVSGESGSTISSPSYYAAGLAGAVRAGSSMTDNNISNVTITAPYAGGMVGLASVAMTISGGSVSNTTITGTECTGYVVGYGTSTTISNVTIADNVTATENGKSVYKLNGASVAKIEGKDTEYDNLQDALSTAKNGETVILLCDVDATGSMYSGNTNFNLWISKDITLDGKDFTLAVKGRGIGVQGASSNINVTFKDITVKNTGNANGCCIDTQGKIASLTLDNVTLTGSLQPLTISGDQSETAKVTINNSTIIVVEDANKGYAITTFNPVSMDISDSTIKGWACFNLKGASSSAGSNGSTIAVKNSKLISINNTSGESNSFALIKIEDDNISVDITGSSIDVTGADNTQSIVSFQKTDRTSSKGFVHLGESNDVTLSGTYRFASDIPDSSKPSDYLSINGGTFNADPSHADSNNDYVADGYRSMKISDTKYVVKKVVDLIVSADNAQKVYGEADPAFTATITGKIEEGYEVKYTLSRDIGEDAGTYKITFIGDFNQDKYYITYYPAILTITKADSYVTAAPTAIEGLVYNQNSQALITEGTAEGGTMYYALGDDLTTEPASEKYTVDIPAGTNTGTYYVWYKVQGDNNHNDTKPEVIAVTIYDAAPQIADDSMTVSKGQSKTLTITDTTGTGSRSWRITGNAQWVSLVKDSDSQAALTANPDFYIAAGEYKCTVTVTNPDNKTSQAQITITVNSSIDSDDEIITEGTYTGKPSSESTAITEGGQSVTTSKTEFTSSNTAILTVEIAITTESTDLTGIIGNEFTAIISIDVSIDVIDTDFKSYSYSLDIMGLPAGLTLSGDILSSDSVRTNFQHVFSIIGTPTQSADTNIIIKPVVTVSSDKLSLISIASKDITISIQEPEPEPAPYIEAVSAAISGDNALTLNAGESKDLSFLAVIVSAYYSDGSKLQLPAASYDITWSTSNTVKGILLSPKGVLNIASSVEAGTYEIPVKVYVSFGDYYSEAVITLSIEVVKIVPEQIPVIITSSLPAGKINEEYEAVISADTEVTWEIDEDILPDNLKVTYYSTYITISGTPTASGTFILNITARNSAGSTAKIFTLKIEGNAISSSEDKTLYIPDTISIDTAIDNMTDEEKDTIETITLTDTQKSSLTDSDLSTIIENLPSLTALDLSDCTNLETIDAKGSESLTTINIDNCSSLSDLNVGGCSSLTEIQGLSNNTTIQKIDASGCSSLVELDVSNCSSLTSLDCSGSSINVLDVSGCSSLTDLNCQSNNLEDLNLDECPSLVTLDCSSNTIGTLNLTGCLNLQRLYCYSNNLETLEVPSQKLEWLVCDNNKLQTLSLEENKKLIRLDCQDNGMSALRINSSVFEDLEWLKCYGQKIPNLAATGNRVDIGGYMNSSFSSSVESSGIISTANTESIEYIKGYNKNGKEIQLTSYEPSTGIAIFESTPAKVTYGYNTGFNGIVMDVTIGEASERVQSYQTDRKRSSSGGCDVGFGVISIAVLGLILRKKISSWR